MAGFPTQDPYGEQPPWGGGIPQQGPPPQPGQGAQPPWGGGIPQQGPPPQPGGPSAVEPYPGYADVHADYHRRQQEEAAAWAAPQPPGSASANPLRNLGNWGMPAARPGLNPHEQAQYDMARSMLRGKILRLVGVLGMVLVLAISGLIRLFV